MTGHPDDLTRVAKRADEILREMHKAYHVAGGDCYGSHCPFEKNLRPFAAKLARAEADLAAALPDLDAAQRGGSNDQR